MTKKTKPLYDKDAFRKTFDKLPDDSQVIDPASEEINVLSEIMALDDDLRCSVVKAVYLAALFRELCPGLKRFVSFECDAPLVKHTFTIFEDLVTNFFFWDDIHKPEFSSFKFPGLKNHMQLRDKFSEFAGKDASVLRTNSEFLMLSENRAYDLGALRGDVKEHLFRAIKVMDFAFGDLPLGTLSEGLAQIPCDNLSGYPDDEIFLLTLFEGKKLVDTEPETYVKKLVA